MSAVRPVIFDYHDYRVFLKDWLTHSKTSNKRYSMRKLCRLAKISPALLSLILAEKRSLSTPAAEKLLPHLGLEDSEQSFFLNLVQLSEGATQDDRLQAFQRIKRFQGYQTSSQPEIEAFHYLTKWYYVAIRELVRHPEFSEDAKWIQKQLVQHVPAVEIKRALEFLIEHKFVVRTENGGLKQSERDIRCEGGVFQLSLNQFHKMILDMGRDSMDRIEKDKRHFSGYTFAINPESYNAVLKIIGEATEKIRQLESRDSGKAGNPVVYHAEFMMIPFTGEK